MQEKTQIVAAFSLTASVLESFLKAYGQGEPIEWTGSSWRVAACILDVPGSGAVFHLVEIRDIECA